MHKSRFLAASSVMALSSVMSTNAFAQAIEQVVVSASRIQIAGYQQPTPVSVVGAAQLLEAANSDIGDTLRQMPSMGASATPEKGTNGNASNATALGISGINLRNLGSNRTLVLFDGQRVVSPNLSGGVDLSTIPNTIVQRVDVVTGGASAAWGSDAISGVVNIVINKNFTGLKASIDGQDTGQDTRRSYGFTVTNGFDILGGRSHIEWVVTYNDSPSSVFESSAHWFNNPGLIANPLYVAGNHAVPQLIHVNNGGQRDWAGGDITTGPLAGIGFGAGGQITTFHVPNCSYYATTNTAPYLATTTSQSVSYCYGGSTNQHTSAASIGLLSFPLATGTGFFMGSYKLTPDIAASLMLNYAYNRGLGSSLTIDESAIIKTDNAFLNPAVLARMGSAGVSTITVSSNMTDPLNIDNAGNIHNFQQTVGAPFSKSVRQMYRAVVTLDGALSDTWSWSAYYQHSENHLYEVDTAIEIKQNFLNATDAITVTAANVGKSGLAIGSVACRTTVLTNPTNGCVPFNIMGTGVADPSAVRYILDNNDFYHLNTEEDSAGLSMQGVLPWDLLGAGAPATSFGVEYRKEAAVTSADLNGDLGALGGGNFVGMRGEYTVIEGFAELDIPLIKNGIVNSLDGNLAGRMTSYSTSGLVETWKMGLTSQINDDIRLRFTMSYDIRAPSLGELFNDGPASGGQIDYKTGNNVPSVLSETHGNPNLFPEAATTYSGGIVLTPHWVPGLTMSFDWYSISVKGIIQTPSTTQERNFCTTNQPTPAGGNYCDDWVYGAPIIPGTNPNGLRFVYVYPFNNGFLSTSGLDFVADYAFDFMGGNLAWHLLGDYNDEQTSSVFGTLNADGTQAVDDTAGERGQPKMRMTLGATYTAGPWSGTIQSRYLGTGTINNNWTSGVQIDDNRVAQVAYLDLRGSYRWNDNVQFYLSVDNVFDTPPPVTVLASPSTNGTTTTAASTYDILGRMWHAGVRFNW